ncbi:MAG TPA: biotin/lipoyl-containing protein, partial [Candidatus Limnocylindrales bacterium]
VEAIGWPRGPGIRIDAGIDVGTNVTGAFDPLLAKVCAHGKDRATALDRLMAALDGTTVLGLTTNLRFLRWLVRQDVVGAGEARTDSLERIWPPDDLADRAAVPPEAWAEAASILVAIPTSSEDCWSGGWRITGRPVVRVATDGNERSVEVPAGMDEAAGGATRRPVSVLAGQVVHVDVDGRSQPFSIAPAPDVDRAARAAERHLARSAPIEAPMPGTILALHAGRGNALRPGEPVLTIEAMKMEHVVRAPIGGRLAELDAVPGQRVARGQALGLVESEDTREPATAVPPNEA